MGWVRMIDLTTGAADLELQSTSSRRDRVWNMLDRSALPAVRLLALTREHWDAVRTIYEEGLGTGQASFETRAPDWIGWDAAHLGHCRLVAVQGEPVLGWAALAPVSRREVYAGVAEVSVYVAASARGRGIGRLLLEELIRQSESAGIWTLQASIFPENLASLRLHESCGFRQLGRRERIARHYGVWRDTVLCERRSRVTGQQALTEPQNARATPSATPSAPTEREGLGQ
jgi:L-amino acid N-acyltransferase YncA